MKINSKGVSLPELLAVIVIMGIIAIIAVAAFTSMINNTEEDAKITEIEEAMTRVVLYLEATPGGYTADKYISRDWESPLRKSIALSITNDYGGNYNIPHFYRQMLIQNVFYPHGDDARDISFNLDWIETNRVNGMMGERVFDFSNPGCETNGTSITLDNIRQLITTECFV